MFDAFQSSAGNSGSQDTSASTSSQSVSADTASQVTDTTQATAQDAPTPPQTPNPAAAAAAERSVKSRIQAAQQLAGSQAAAPATPEQPPFTPNFKFKVMDKEHEIPEAFRGIIKDPETEKMAREVFEKAYGLDNVKTRFNEVREKYREIDHAHKQVLGGISELRELYSRGDFDSFFNRLSIPEEKVLQWVVNKAKYNQLPPEQRQVLDEKRAAEQRAFELEKQQSHYQQQIEEQATQAKAISLQVALERPDIKSLVDAFDSAPGRKPGSFRQAVIDAGEIAWYRSNGKVDLTPEQAIQQVIGFYGNPAQQKQEPAIIPVQRNVAPPQTPAAPAPAKPSLPNVAGRQSASVSKSKPRSIADLKKLAAQMSG